MNKVELSEGEDIAHAESLQNTCVTAPATILPGCEDVGTANYRQGCFQCWLMWWKARPKSRKSLRHTCASMFRPSRPGKDNLPTERPCNLHKQNGNMAAGHSNKELLLRSLCMKAQLTPVYLSVLCRGSECRDGGTHNERCTWPSTACGKLGRQPAWKGCQANVIACSGFPSSLLCGLQRRVSSHASLADGGTRNGALNIGHPHCKVGGQS